VAANLGEHESPSPTWYLSFLHAFHVEPSPRWCVGTCTSQKNKLKIFRIGDEGLSPYCLLPLAALGGEECGVAALVSSTGALKSFLIRTGWCSFTQKNVRAITLSIICMETQSYAPLCTPCKKNHPMKFSCVSMLFKVHSGIKLSNYFIVPILFRSHDISQVLGLASYNDTIKDGIMLALHIGTINPLRICH
jgi:hypothetical protein